MALYSGLNSLACVASMFHETLTPVPEGEPDAESDLSNNDEEEGDADSQRAAAANSKSKSGPKTKSELYKYFSGKGPNKMVYEFLSDRSLQLCAIIVVYISAPIEAEYASDLKSMEGGPICQGLWAERSVGKKSWWATARKILEATYGVKLLQRLNFTRPHEQIPHDSDHTWLRQEQDLAQLACDFGHELFARYVWANIPFMFNLPQAFALYLLADRDARAAALEILGGVLTSVFNAQQHWRECLTRDKQKAHDLETVFNHIGWCHHQLATELLAFMLQSDFNPDHVPCRQLAAKLFRGSSTTKHCLEDVFAHLQSMTAKATNNKRMSHWARYFYSTTARSVVSGGIQTVMPDRADWDSVAGRTFSFIPEYAKMFDMNNTSMPEPDSEDSILLPKPEGLQKRQWKAAGPESNQRGAAAMVYLHNDAPSHWANIKRVWASFSHQGSAAL